MALKIRDLTFPAYSFSFMVRWRVDGVSVDLTDWTGKAEIRDSRDGELLSSWSVAKTVTPTDGLWILSVTNSQAEGLVGQNVESNLIVANGEQVKELWQGQLNVTKRITAL
jgi:hypothetical protein